MNFLTRSVILVIQALTILNLANANSKGEEDEVEDNAVDNVLEEYCGFYLL